jgi:hypothetical protein
MRRLVQLEFTLPHLGGVVMLSRRLLPAVTSLVVVSGLLTFLSCEIDAKPEKTVKSEKMSRPSKCCQPGYEGCPTTGPNGCDCCGVSVTGVLIDYKDNKGSLQIEGLDTPLAFEVDSASYPNADKELPGKVKQSSQFILKTKMYEYETNGKELKHWFGKKFVCEGMGNDGGKMKDRTQDFVQGLELSRSVAGVRTIVEGLVPSYPTERDKDKR